MNTAYKHLESRLKIAELTIAQWSGIVLGLVLGIGWGMYLSPFGAYISFFTAVYLGGIPAMAAWLASQMDFDLWLHLRAALSWRRGGHVYLPGPGQSALGYVVISDPDDERALPEADVVDLDSEALWD
ncbi:hypothetical protein [Conexibacter sp. CPCC 206217]|uniref:hypothetical protein n=1 Tax=Conexibacter sp. CPCC 206217 TaxID=3064574 RepID=UPI00271F718B|nr:hypothetical protein [Conexibacter sp. CPCC 206217]MDO8208994.1 hypothetical protein [Conexibacter sp. CPCC 206217]